MARGLREISALVILVVSGQTLVLPMSVDIGYWE